jgi:NAD(P)-dependent dehydrogenase (short-subunit alcohol dehydrogenase family)
MGEGHSTAAEQGKVAVVTGAGSGIGRAVALELLGAGWSVALAGRRTERLEETAAPAPEGARNGATLVVRADVAQLDDVAALFTAVRERFGRLDPLFNNAGTFGPGGVPVEDLAYEAWRHVVDTNLNGAYLCAQAGVPAAEGAGSADVARTVRHMAELPLEANVRFATVLATAMPYVGRG